MTGDDGVIRWHAVAGGAALHQAAYRRIVDASTRATQRRGRFLLVLSGGNTPRAVYRMLREADLDWSSWQIYFGDERCLPPEDPERNSRMVAEAWLDHLAIPPPQCHTMHAELGAVVAAQLYGGVLSAVDEFDLVLLGLGEDGHTASLFPGHDWGAESGAADVLAVLDAPKPPPQRVSLSAARLSRTREVLFLVDGESKREAVQHWRAGADIPARAIRPSSGVDVLLDASLLS